MNMYARDIQKNRKPDFQKSKISYDELLAFSLVEFAKGDEVFAKHLKYLLDTPTLRSSNNHSSLSYCHVTVALPRDRYAAILRAEWLTEKIKKEPASRVVSILRAWARDSTAPSPRQIVVGFVGVAIPGPTLGLIKRRVRMMVIVKEGARTDDLQFTRRVICVSHALTLRELRRVQGDAYKLEPDFSEWFFGARELVFYRAPGATFGAILSELDTLSIPLERDAGSTLVAVSPIVHDAFTSLKYELTTLDLGD